jgi:hypothetical protein
VSVDINLNLTEESLGNFYRVCKGDKATSDQASEEFWMLLLNQGYLTLAEWPSKKAQHLQLKVPNEEVRWELTKKLSDFYRKESDSVFLVKLTDQFRILINEYPCQHEDGNDGCSIDQLHNAVNNYLNQKKFNKFRVSGNGLEPHEATVEFLLNNALWLAEDWPAVGKFGPQITTATLVLYHC